MATHRHWASSDTTPTAPVTETAVPAVATQPITPSFVWVVTYQSDRYEDPITKVFQTQDAANAWKTKYALVNGDGPDEDDGEDEDDYADRFFDDASFFAIRNMEVTKG